MVHFVWKTLFTTMKGICAMKRSRFLMIPLLGYSVLTFLTPLGLADVVPGDVIDKTNWEKVQGLVPDSVLTWVKDGKIVLNVGELSYEPRDCFPPHVLEGSKKNAGRYALADDHWIVEAGTGKRADYIVGVPFPEIDPPDPKAGEKIMYNHKYVQYGLGNARGEAPVLFIGPNGYERAVDLEVLQTAMDGNPKCMGSANPDGLIKQQILVVRSPYDMAGMAVMTWRFRDPNKQDMCFGYAPAIRRVRRMSPANRSDSLFGSDLTNDDVSLYDGMLAAMEWRLVREQEALIPFMDVDPARIEQNGQGEWKTTDKIKPAIYGYEKEGWQGAPWAPVNWFWVKRPTYVIEMRPRDPYYNYGTQHLWFCPDARSPAYKIIHDRSGKYWKTLAKARMVGESEDKNMRLTIMGDTIYVDERSSHATLGPVASPKIIVTYFADMKLDCFSLAGFQKFCK
jgi:hypothetical protein